MNFTELPKPEKKELIMKLREKGMTYVAIAARFGVSRQRIHQLSKNYNSTLNPGKQNYERINVCSLCKREWVVRKDSLNNRYCYSE